MRDTPDASKKLHAPATNEAVEKLAVSVTELADQVAVLRDAIDELREDFSWTLKNFSPAERPQHVILQRMASDRSDGT